MTLRLADLEAPLDDVEFPNGTKHIPVPFGKDEYRLWRDMDKAPDDLARGHMLLQIVKACYPTATDEDLFEGCTPKMLIAMAAHAGRKIEQVMAALKNADAVVIPGTPPPATAPSSPKTNGTTSASKSRKRSVKTSGTSTTASPTDDPSSSGTATTSSPKPSASTRSGESLMTSTVPS